MALCKKLLAMGDEPQKCAALDTLGKITTLESLSILVTYAKKQTESQPVRDMAFSSLVELNNQACVPDFIDMLKTPGESSHFVSCAVELLGRLGDPRAFDVLAEIAGNADDSPYDSVARGNALLALSRLHDTRAVPIIQSALQADTEGMVMRAITAGAFLRSKSLTTGLANVAKARDKYDPRTRGAAVEAIILAGTGPMPSVFDTIAALAVDRGESPRVRQPALILVAMYETDASRAVLIEVAGRLDDQFSPIALKSLFEG
jgi:HEAT repeat protein